MLGALILLAQTAQARNFDHAGAPVQRVVEQMAKEYGEKATADGTMQRDYIILDLRNETFDSAKALVAKTLNASWHQDKDGTWILHRSKQQEKQDEQTTMDCSAKLFSSMIAKIKVPERLTGEAANKFVADLVRTEALNPNSYAQELVSRLPWNRALSRLVGLFDPKTLAQIPPGSTVPFDVSGRRGLHALPKGARQVLQEFVHDQSALADVMELRGGTTQPVSQMARLSPDVDDMVLTLDILSTGVWATLYCPTQKDGYNIMFDLTFVGDTNATKNKWPAGLSDKAHYSDLAKEKIAMRPFWAESPAQTVAPNPGLLDLFTHPKDHDPLELALSQTVRQSADALGKSFCVEPLDFSQSLEGRLSRSEFSLEQTLETLLPSLFFTVDTDPHSVVVRPREPSFGRRQFYDRGALAQTILDVRARSPRTLDAMAHLAASNYPYSGMPTTPLSAMSGAMFPPWRRAGRAVLSLYDGMTQQQKTDASKGYIDLSPARLSPAATNALDDLYSAALATPDPEDMGFSRTDLKPFYDALAWLRHVGLAQARVRVKVLMRRALYTMGADPSRHIQRQRTSLELEAFRAAWGDLKDPAAAAPQLYKMVDEHGIVISLVSGGKEAVIGEFFDPSLLADDPFTTIDKLPADVQQEYKRQYDAAVKEIKQKYPPPRA